MQVTSKKILFLSHEATLSGAILVLLEFMRWMKRHKPEMQIALLLTEDGPVKERFAKVSDVYLYNVTATQSGNRILSFVYNRFIHPAMEARHRRRLLQQLKKNKFDIVYANTAGLGEVLDFLKPLGVKVVSHIHELEFVLQCTGKENVRLTLENTAWYIAVSNEVKNNLVKNLGVEEAKIKVLPPFVDFTKIDSGKEETGILAIRQELDIKPGSFIIGGAGSIEWRKGADIFVEVAIQVLSIVPQAHFIWVGNARETHTLEKLNFDIKKAGLEKNVKFIGPRENPYPYFQAFDLFLLTSREDPYPLVCIENMYLEKPVLCFEPAGGAAGLISAYNCGKSLPYLDVNLMASTVIKYIKGELKPNASVNTQRLKEEHSVSTIAPKILNVINEWSGG